MRPKSKATMVELLFSTPCRSSILLPARVMVSSVLSGRISLTELTRVVLPTSKPPTTTILRACSAVAGRGMAGEVESEVVECNEHLLQHVRGGKGAGRGGLGRGVARGDLPGVDEVGQQNTYDGDRQLQVSGDLHDRGRALAHTQDRGVFRLHPGGGSAFGDDEGDRVQGTVGTLAASTGDDVQAIGAFLLVRAAHIVPVLSRGGVVRCSPICSTSSLRLCPIRPGSASSSVRTARWAPSPASTMNSSPP